MTTTRLVRGLSVTVHNTRPDVDTEQVFARLDDALGLIERTVPHYFRHLRRDFRGILVERYACRGAYLPDQGACLIELTFSTNPAFSTAQVTILHEAMHARLHRLGFPLAFPDRARQERFCRRAEIEFGALVPDGAPILARAHGALQGGDDEVAPRIDPALAARRIAEVDQAARRSRGE
jgi:hypothetical protein